MTGARKVELVILPGRIVYHEGEGRGEGSVIEVPAAQAEALISEGLAEKTATDKAA